MELKLEFPNKGHKYLYETLIKEWGNTEKIPTAPGRLFAGENFEEFLEIVNNDLNNNPNGVNAHLFFLMGDNEILGGIQIRHNIDHPRLIEDGGHIGYGISPKHRKKGYATNMLKLALEKAKKFGLKEVLLTCDLNNIGSNKVIKANGGIFERKTVEGDKNRYWINT